MVKLNKIIIPIFILIAVFVAVKTLNTAENQSPIDSSQPKYVQSVTAAPIESNITSPDGKSDLVIKERKDGTNTIWTVEIDNTLVFSERLPDNVSVTIPFNTFSPDNKYIFLNESTNGNKSYIVLASNGKPILQNGENLEITKYFYAKYPNYKITDVTGWASPSLIIVNTDKLTGGIGPGFWFDVSSKSFIQLSTRFN